MPFRVETIEDGHGVGILAQRPSNKLGGCNTALIDYDVHFKHCIRLVKVVEGYTFKYLNWLVGVLGVERFWIVA